MFERDYNRAPRDLSYDLHKKFNFFFEKKFGWEVRSGVFCFGGRIKPDVEGKNFDASYGTKTYLIFPKDEYSIVWNRSIYDLYADFENSGPNYSEEEENYDEIYGEGCEDAGEWTLDDEKTGEYDKEDAAKWCVINKELFGYDEWNEDDAEDLRNRYGEDFETKEEYEMFIKDDLNGQLIWEPKITFDEYFSDLEDSYFNNELPTMVEDVVDGYVEVNNIDDDVFQNTVYPSTELSLKCDEYYLVDQSHLKEIIERIWN